MTEAVRRATGVSNMKGIIFIRVNIIYWIKINMYFLIFEDGSVLISEANIDRLLNKLSRMRGAALKLGQMISIQGNEMINVNYIVTTFYLHDIYFIDNDMLPAQLERVLLRVQNSAHYMPNWQMEVTNKLKSAEFFNI